MLEPPHSYGYHFKHQWKLKRFWLVQFLYTIVLNSCYEYFIAKSFILWPFIFMFTILTIYAPWVLADSDHQRWIKQVLKDIDS